MISVVTGTYNHEKTISKLFHSLEDQTYKNFEWIVCDDGSTDGTWDLIKSFFHKSIFPMEAFQQMNKGMRLSMSLNNGLRHAKGNIVYIVMGDSYLDNDTLAKLNTEYIQGSAGSTVRKNVDDNGHFKSTDWRVLDLPLETISLKGKQFPWTYLTGNGMLVDNKVLKAIGYWPEEYEGYGRDDWSVFLRLYKIGVPLYMYNTITINHVYHGEGSPDNKKNVELFINEVKNL